MTELIKHINKLLRKIKSSNQKIEKIKDKLPFFKSKNIKKKNKKKIQKLKEEKRKYNKKLKELKNYKKRKSNIFKQKDMKKAKMRFNILYKNLQNLPPTVTTFIEKLKKNFDKTTNYRKYDFFPTTTNQLECYNGTSLPDNQKRICQTNKGLDRAIKLGRIRWTKRNRKKIQS
jgi:predicted RNase H-like nuclease (RuvC/YqgF family)